MAYAKCSDENRCPLVTVGLEAKMCFLEADKILLTHLFETFRNQLKGAKRNQLDCLWLVTCDDPMDPFLSPVSSCARIGKWFVKLPTIVPWESGPEPIMICRWTCRWRITWWSWVRSIIIWIYMIHDSYYFMIWHYNTLIDIVFYSYVLWFLYFCWLPPLCHFQCFRTCAFGIWSMVLF